MEKEVPKILGELYTKDYAKQGALQQIEDRIPENYYVDGKNPDEDSNHEYWRHLLISTIEDLRNRNITGELLNMKPIYSSVIEQYNDIAGRGIRGEISLRDAYTQIRLHDAERNAILKENINHDYVQKIRAEEERERKGEKLAPPHF
ncbi:MAG: hypothetical protein HHAS10_07550 [Candidatus Altimarinota bacterium]